MSGTDWIGGFVVCAVALAGATVAYAQEASPQPCLTCAVGQKLPGGKPQTRQSEASGISFTVVTSPGKVMIRAEGRGVVFEKSADATGTTLRVRSGADSVEVETRTDGTVQIVRNSQSLQVRADDVLADNEGRVQKLTQGSEALKSLTRLALTLEQVDRPEALAVLTSLAVVRALHGDALGNQLLARRFEKPALAGIVRAAQRTRQGDTEADCYAAYERYVARSYDRYSRCLIDYWWNQPVQYACGLEWAINAELAWFQLIACAGGFPIGV